MLRARLRNALPPALGALVGGALGGWGLGEAGTIVGAPLGGFAAAFAAGQSAIDPSRATRGRTGSAGETARPEAGLLGAENARLMLDQLPLAILLIDRRSRVQVINQAAVRLFGRLPGVFHVSALRAPRLLQAIETALGADGAGEIDFGLARRGSSDLHAVIRPLPEPAKERAENAPVLLVAIEDRGEPRRAADLHRDFVANASHELKTPLASISGIIETLTGHARDDPEATERFLVLMASQVERMKRLVEDLLSLNRIETNERIRPETPQSLPRIVREAAQSLEPMAAERSTTLVCDAPEEDPLVPGDRRELTQLFTNLIENAIKYGAPGTEVAIRFLGGAPDGMRVGVAVSDHGPGIAREHIPRLTERFYRVSAGQSRAKGGTGLGLAIVKHVVNRHRGELQIESEIRKGSTFTVWLPVHPPELGSGRSGPTDPATPYQRTRDREGGPAG